MTNTKNHTLWGEHIRSENTSPLPTVHLQCNEMENARQHHVDEARADLEEYDPGKLFHPEDHIPIGG